MYKLIFSLAFGLIGLAASAFLLKPKPVSTMEVMPIDSAIKNPIELGDVTWQRDLELGRATAKAENKPLLILFQEVPGCSNCTRYGSVTLSHPLVVEAIETYFIPVCIYNNEKGKDAAALKLFNEPAWNNPVVRIVDTDNQDLVERMADFRSQSQIISGITAAMRRLNQTVPVWLSNLEIELNAQDHGVETATFAMHCFWVGEGAYGALPGVVSTTAGWQNGKEVVQVQYDPRVTSQGRLARPRNGDGFETCSSNTGFKTDKEPKYYLSKTPYRFLPMTPSQLAKANSMVGQHLTIESILSPRQMEMMAKIQNQSQKKWESQIEAQSFTTAWKSVQKQL
jgi:hypothetical protein